MLRNHWRSLVLAACVLAPLTNSAQIIEAQNRIRVRTFKSYASVRVSGFGIRLPAGVESSVQKEILPVKKKLRIVREDAGWSVADIDALAASEFYFGTELKISGEMLKVENEAAASDLTLVAKGMRFDVIAELDMDTYLKGVLPSEMPVKWPLETLKAQVVAARTYAMSIMRERAHEIYHVDDTINHQVFRMQNFVTADFSAQEKIQIAIQEARGIYLTDRNGETYKTYFHSDCGGVTEEPKFVWNYGKKNGTVKDESCRLNLKSAWHKVILRDELTKTLTKHMGLEANVQISDITVASYTDSDRVRELLIYFWSEKNGEEFRALNAQAFRELFGFNRIKSTYFTINFSANGLELSGRGHGHGVGMCQTGARVMAAAGAKFTDILKRYYPHAELHQPAVIAFERKGTPSNP